jgi:hypothetical protein
MKTWISIKDRMPEFGQIVAVTGQETEPIEVVTRTKWHQNGGQEGECWLSFHLTASGRPYEIEGVTHWMPMPELPKDEKLKK